ncbi:hypothetical protein DITRI_Ditri12bG0015900 [Diplodiscus trichospermus]
MESASKCKEGGICDIKTRKIKCSPPPKSYPLTPSRSWMLNAKPTPSVPRFAH